MNGCDSITGRKARGFTLIELLVVIAIIAILGALMFSALGDSIVRAREAACMNNLRQMSVALFSYDQLNRGYPPAQDLSQSYFGSQQPLLDVLLPQMKGNTKVLFCPRSVKAEQLNMATEVAASRIGYFYWAWKSGDSGIERVYPEDVENVWNTQDWNKDIGQMVILTDHFRDKEYWQGYMQDWQYHAPRDVEQSLSEPGSLAVLGDGSVRKIAPRP